MPRLFAAATNVQVERTPDPHTCEWPSLAVEFAMNGVLVISGAGRIQNANPAACAILGRTREELLAADLAAVDKGLDRWVREHLGKGRLGLRASGGTLEWPLGNETPMLLEYRTAALDQNEFLFIFQDVTERDSCKLALDDSQRRLDDLIAGVKAIVWEADPGTSQFTFVSSHAEAMLGYPLQQWLREPQFRVNHMHAEDRDRWLAFCGKAVAEGGVHHFEHRMLRADGQVVWMKDIFNVLTDKNGQAARVQGVMIDITEGKRLEETRRQLEDHIQKAEKLESIGTLAGGIAHDFKNIMTVVLGFAELGLGKVKPGDKLHHYLEEILRNGRCAVDLTEKLMSFRRRPALDFLPIRLNEAIDATSRMLQRLVGENIELALDLPPALPSAMVDPGEIERMLINLCANARDAMPDGGRVILGVRAVQLEEGHVLRQPWIKPGYYVCLSVIDSGIGMDEATQARIFEPFFTTKEPGKGTGLGLAAVYGIVQQHRGLIHVSSRPGHGTTFSVYLPALPDGITGKAL